MIYRKACSKDLAALCALRALLADDPGDRLLSEYAPFETQKDRLWIQKCLRSRKRVILVAENKDGLCAHAIIAVETVPKSKQPYYTYHKKALLVHLYVAPDKRRCGIGQGLMRYMLVYLKKQGVEFVDLECYIQNQKAAALYNKVGFQDVWVRKRFKL